jgi:hypothetical protein
MTGRRSLVARTGRPVAAFVCVGYVLCLAQPLDAKEYRLEGSTLAIRVSSGEIVNNGGKAVATLKEQPTYLLRNGDTVSILVSDYNPLLFTYKVEVTAAESEQHKTAASFARSLLEVTAPFNTTKAAGARSLTLVVEGLDLNAFIGRLQALDRYMRELPGELDLATGTDDDIATLKKDVAAWHVQQLADALERDSEAVSSIVGKCLMKASLSSSQPGVTCLYPLDAEPASAVTNATDIAAENRAADKPAAQKRAEVARAAARQAAAKAPAGESGRSEPAVISDQQPPRPGTAAPAPVSPPPGPTPAPPAGAPIAPAPRGIQTLGDFVTQANSLKADILASLALLKEFAADTAALNKAKDIGCDTKPSCVYSLDDRTITITVGAATKYQEFMSKETKTVRDRSLGKHTLHLSAYSPVSLGVAPAFVLLFLHSPTFRAVKSGDHLVIQSDDPQLTGYNVAAMLTITPRAWSEPTFGGQFQLGVSPTKDKVGFYLGAGIHVQELFTFGGGVTWQQSKRLTDGLTVGQTIGSPDDIRTTNEFKPGFYFHITTNIKK